MAENRMIPVPPTFDLNTAAQQLVQLYQQKGFTVSAYPLGQGATIRVEKDNDGIKKLVGLSVGITVNLMLAQNPDGSRILNVSFADADWTSKIIGYAVGWFLCWIPFVCAIIGTVKQLDLPKNIANDITAVSSGMPPMM